MKVNTSMPRRLRLYYEKEMMTPKDAFSKGHFAEAWRHLERAHILGQPYPFQHSEVHWRMLKFGF